MSLVPPVLMTAPAVGTPTTFPRFIQPASGVKAVTIRGYIDETGAVIDGVPGNDLEVIGGIDKDGDGVVDVEGLLITGELTQMGFLDSGGPTDIFDFRFIITGGALVNDPELAISFLAKDIGIIMQSEGSSFAGDFGANFDGGAKGTLGPIDAACTMDAAIVGCVQAPAPVVVDSDCKGKLVNMTLEYTGLGCDASSNSQDAKRVNCIGGGAVISGLEGVSVLITDKSGKKVWGSASNVNVGDTILAEAANAKTKGKKAQKHIDSNTKITIFAGGDVIEQILFDTSCNQPINAGDQFGSLKVVALTSTKGGVVELPDEDPEPVCITELPNVAPPHCNGKISSMAVRYTGGGCDSSSNTQSAGSVICTGDANGVSPVRIVISDPSGANVYQDTGMVAATALGDVVDAAASNGGLSVLKGDTVVKVYDADNNLIEQVQFHTSCSEPINLGDRFGSIEIFSMTTTDGGVTAAEALPVVYEYSVTNNSILYPLQNVTVIDDVFGEVPGSPIASIGPGETATLTLTVLVGEETTSTATVVGYVGGIVECEALATVTITEEAPPVPQKECTTSVQAMLLKYTGPEVLGATVEFSAANFPNKPVVYSGVDLTAGTILSLATENGFTIDATAHKNTALGADVGIAINGVVEKIHTSCSSPIVAGEPAPLNPPTKGAPSPNWTVVDFTQN